MYVWSSHSRLASRSKDRRSRRRPARLLDLTGCRSHSEVMSLVVWAFLVHEDDSVERLSMSRFNRWYGRRDLSERWPEHAGKRLRYVSVILQREADGTMTMVRPSFSYVQVDAEGRHDAESIHDSMRDFGEMMQSVFLGNKEDDVRRRYRAAHTWEPSEAIKDAITDAIANKRGPPRRKARLH